LCGSRNTTLQSPFGPTLCRSLHYCNNCRNGFEGFKPI
jgi:ring-1,2-phenylacetyl-CoA epoxidase subunit PaaD